jgi:hypothetical protein
MKKTILTALILIPAALITSCSANLNMSTSINKKIKEVKLEKNRTARLGFTPVDAAWGCREIEKKYENMATSKMSGIFKFDGVDAVLEEKAVAYANQANLKTNYIYIFLPTEYAVNGFSTSSVDNATITYYTCKNPPALSNRIW